MWKIADGDDGARLGVGKLLRFAAFDGHAVRVEHAAGVAGDEDSLFVAREGGAEIGGRVVERAGVIFWNLRIFVRDLALGVAGRCRKGDGDKSQQNSCDAHGGLLSRAARARRIAWIRSSQ